MNPFDLQGDASQEALGRRLASCLVPPCVIWLEGDLGAGKTTLARGILRGLGHQGRVPSPTYTLIESYELGSLRVHHLDLYRLADPEELEYLGLADLCDGRSMLLVEWPERGAGSLPAADLRIQIRHAGAGRILSLFAQSEAGGEIAKCLVAAH
jgi:tRNA threonylcarbamoyladenosine biosynthesis protein TsaE